MKRTLSLILTSIFILAYAGTARAEVYQLTTYLKPTSGVNIVAHAITGGVWATSPLSTLTMDFGTLVWEPGTTAKPVNMWLAPTYYAVDISNVASGSPTVYITYVEKDKPSGAVHGLGYKAIATVKKEVFTSSTTPPAESAVDAFKLIDVTTTKTINSSNFTGGWARIYLGIYSGDPAVTGAEGFLATDVSGTYTGQVTITATAN